MQLRNAVLTLGIALLSVGSLAAQETTGRIEGRVLDPGRSDGAGRDGDGDRSPGSEDGDDGHRWPLHGSNS